MIYLPGTHPTVPKVDDVILIHSGTLLFNVHIWKITSSTPLRARLLFGDEYEEYRPHVDRWIEREEQKRKELSETVKSLPPPYCRDHVCYCGKCL